MPRIGNPRISWIKYKGVLVGMLLSAVVIGFFPTISTFFGEATRVLVAAAGG